MLFNSFEFIFLFLPLTLIGFFTLSRLTSAKLSLIWLVGMSLVFYGWWNPAYLSLILLSMALNYGCSLGMQSKAGYWRKAWLITGLTANLGALGYYKYANFLTDQWNILFHTGLNLHDIILPLAISFFTFQQIAFLVDSYRGEFKNAHPNFLNYSLFVTFFPQLIAGPIVHHSDTIPQFKKESVYRFSYKSMSIGMTIFAIGIFKKVMLADTVAPIANAVFEAETPLTFFDSWMGALAYSLQLYFDFSGYTDMAIGAAYMFGIKLPQNFNSPYKASSIVDFWRRWHITLSHFLRDYLYFPLGGSKKGKARQYTNLFITMLLGGLWHGAGWTFIIWGMLHGTYLIINHGWRSLCARLNHQSVFLERLFYQAITLLAVVIGWVYFRAADVSTAHTLLTHMSGLNGISLPAELSGKLAALSRYGFSFDGLSTLNILPGAVLMKVIPLIGIVLFLPNSSAALQKLEALDMQPLKTKRFIQHLAPAAAAVALYVCIANFMAVSEFLYFNF